MPDTMHILPVNDIKEHEEAEDCPCGPDVQLIYGEWLVVHNSFDGREFREHVKH